MTAEPEFLLTKAELKHVQKIINEAKQGRYTLKKLFGPKRWDEIGDDGDKRIYGGRFLASYHKGDIRRLRLDGLKSFSRAYLISDY